MRLDTFLADATQQLTTAGIATARLDILVLLEDCLGVDRAQLLAHPELELTPSQHQELMQAVHERTKHTPLAYIRGKAAFYGRDFRVTPKVLVPRPESEAMIDIIKAIDSLPLQPRIADIGTGSGCLGITSALELPAAKVWLFDIDADALQIAGSNAAYLDALVRLAQNDLLVGVREQFDVILANLPYVPEAYPINAAARFEPEIALFAGPDGLDLYRALWQQLAGMAHKPPHVITESLSSQHTALQKLAEQNGYHLSQTSGLIQHFVA